MTTEPTRDPTGAASALSNYTPAPKSQRRGIGLCLSGGGFRATLFHLGALRRLNELGILGQLRTITSVSGGSITAAHIAATVPWPLATPMSRAQWEARVAAPLRAFTSKNLRTGAIAKRLLPWKWFHESTAVEAMAARFRERLTRMTLSQLPEEPNFIFCATDMAFGVDWVFERTRMGDYQAGYVQPPPADWPVGTAVAASACFPPVFNPLPMPFKANQYAGGHAPVGKARDAALSDLRLTDGGDYDNLGLEPVWNDHAFVLSSDGGSTFEFAPDANLFSRIQRYVSIVENQARALRKRWLISSFIANVMEGTYWGVGSARSSYDPDDTVGYSKALATELIDTIRTDLDAFSEAEAAVLENHGYLLADIAIRQHVRDLLPNPIPPLAIPHPAWMEEPRVRQALAGSGKQTLLGRR
ncbi:MAG TPA: patatin-like phospholipase family protein [Gemmatimonadaceae bacterium]|nr:patatin-like phospholipase family protein [Gemmatimonadaceae bacterium]